MSGIELLEMALLARADVAAQQQQWGLAIEQLRRLLSAQVGHEFRGNRHSELRALLCSQGPRLRHDAVDEETSTLAIVLPA